MVIYVIGSVRNSRRIRRSDKSLPQRIESYVLVERRCQMTQLTETEREIAKCLARGQTHREIAERLSLTPAAVSYSRQIINRKLGTHTREELYKFV